jgi:DNA (cytosine-5)-methyltransferase 1
VRVGSLCTGIGGAEMALDMMGLKPEVVWYAEFDPKASQLLADKMPGVPNLGDITKIDWTSLEPVDAITAGYPCQPFSTAGKRRGTDDERHLWPYIADALRVLRPRYTFLENVSAHLGLGFDAVLSDLASLGFDAEWTTLRASDVGACHQRDRLFIVATDTHQGRRQLGNEWGGVGELRHDADRCGEAGGWPSDLPGGQVTEWGKYGPAIARWTEVIGRPAPDPTVDGKLNPTLVEWMMGYPEGWTADMSRTAALKALGNAIVPHQAAAAWGHLLGSSVHTHTHTHTHTPCCRPHGPATPTDRGCTGTGDRT